MTKPGAHFFFDTLNCAFVSKLVAINIWQEWTSRAFMPPRLHEWRMFIWPEELRGLLVQAGFEFKEYRGTSLDASIPRINSFSPTKRGPPSRDDSGVANWLGQCRCFL